MSITIFRPGQQLYIPGVQVLHTNPPAASSNWWEVSGQTCVAAYQPKGAASLAASYINLANPGTNNAAPGVAPTFNTADGWTLNGTTQFLTTGVTPAAGWSMIVRFSASTATTTAIICGAFGGTSARLAVGLVPSTTAITYQSGGATDVVVGTLPTSGVLAVAGTSGYRDGILAATTGAWSGTGVAIFIGQRNGGATAFFPGKIQALAIYSTTLSAGNVASLTTAMNAL